MIFKIDTKEKFTVITPQGMELSDNLTEELTEIAKTYLQKDTKNIVLNLQNIQTVTETAATNLATLQQSFYENNASFVICQVNPSVEAELDRLGLLEIMNITPSESEAWDIVQMEEIERDLMDDDEPEFREYGGEG